MAYHFTPRALPEAVSANADLAAVNGDTFSVSQRLRALIESFEPKAHRFAASVAREGASPMPRYLLEVGQEFDAVSPEHSTWIKESGILWRPSGSIDERIVFDARKIGGRHLWRNAGLGAERRYWVSDRLMNAMLAEGMTGMLVDHYDETDANGCYQAKARSLDRVYLLFSSHPMRPNNAHVPLTIKAKPLNGDMKKVSLANPANAEGKSAFGLEKGFAVDPTHVPTRAYYFQNAKGLPVELFGGYGLPITVSARFMEIVERLEPGRHQFLPIEFVDKKGDVIELRYVFIVCNQIDSVNRAHSQMLFDRLWYNPGREFGTLVYDKAAIGGRHVWRDARISGNPVHFSAEFAEAVHADDFPTLRYAFRDLR